MKPLTARIEILKYNKPFITDHGPYRIRFEPNILGSVIHVKSIDNDHTWTLVDAPDEIVVVLGMAAHLLNRET